MSIINLDDNIKNILINSCEAAASLGIIDISLEHNNKGIMVRGFTGDHGSPVIINHTFTQLTLPFQSFAINNCKNFLARYVLANSMDSNHTTQINIDDNSKMVNSIQFKNVDKSKKFQLKFLAGNANTVKAPKGINDPVCFSFDIDKTITSEMSKAIRAMAGTEITLIYDGSELSYEIKTGDNNTDVLKSTIHTNETNENISFAYSYPFSVLSPILSKNDTSTLHITTRGLLNCSINSLNIYLLPRKHNKNV